MNRYELEHSGILGMRWGHRNGPPYPLKPSQHSASEKKAGWRKSLKKVKKDDVKKKPQDKVEEYENDDHKDDKYFDSRRYSKKDLERLAGRFRTEKEYNEALSNKLGSEERLKKDRERTLPKTREQKKRMKEMARLEAEAEFNDAQRRAIDSQINLMRSQKTLKELNAKPKTKMQKAKAATAEVLGDIGKRTAKDVGGQVAKYAAAMAVNAIAGKTIVNTNTGKKKNGNNDGNNNNGGGKKKKKKNKGGNNNGYPQIIDADYRIL